MAQDLYMIGLVAQDMDRSLEFYRRLGVAIPAGSAGQPHVEVPMRGGLTFFLNARGRVPELDDSCLILEFYLQDRTAVDAKYHELTGWGYSSGHPPFVTAFGMYFATVR